MSTSSAKSTSSPKTVTKTTTVVNNRTGVTTSTSVTKTGNSTTITKTKTIGKAKTVTPSKLAAAAAGDRWICEPNDIWPLCGPVAVANSLLAITGVRAKTSDIEQLYRRAGGISDSGVLLADVLAVAAERGLAGVLLADFRPSGGWLNPGGILDLRLDGYEDAHAAAIAPGCELVLWGDESDPAQTAGYAFAAWDLTWQA